MSRKIAITDEFRQCDLRCPHHHLAGMALHPLECLDEAIGHDGVTDADIGKHRFRERSDIENVAGGIEPLQRDHRPAVEMKFAVVIVLDDRSSRFRGERQ